MKEIEKKYLLEDSILSLVETHGLHGHKITQFYTTITPDKEVSYKETDGRCFRNIKYGTGASGDEEETEITEQKFQKKFKKRIKNPIEKSRYLFEFEGREYAIDIYKKDLKGLYLLEIKFPTMEAYEQFTLPPLLKAHIIREVSFDESYRNSNMVLDGKPGTAYDTDALFAELEKKTIDELDSYFIPNLSSTDALRIVLYKYALCILHYKQRILLQDIPEDLHQFRINIRKSRALLKEFSFLFPKELHTYFSENLERLARQTNQKRDLDVLDEQLETAKEAHGRLQKRIKQQRGLEENHIREMLQGEPSEDFFQAYQKALREGRLLTADHSRETIEESARKVLKKLHQKTVKKIKDLEKAYDDGKLHKIRISLKKLRYLLEEFRHIFGEKKIEKMIEKGKKLQTLLGEFNDALNQETLVHNYISADAKNLSEGRKLEDELLEKSSKKQQKLLRQALKQLRRFKEKPFAL